MAFPRGVVHSQWMASPALNIRYEKSLGVSQGLGLGATTLNKASGEHDKVARHL